MTRQDQTNDSITRASAAGGRERLTLFPALEPFNEGFIETGDGHTLYYAECGKPDGAPALIVHGGPGGGCNPAMRRFHDPAHYRIILLDQRGCGRSRPNASIENNTTWHLVEDIERLRQHLGIRAMAALRRIVGLDALAGVCRDLSRPRHAPSFCVASSCSGSRS